MSGSVHLVDSIGSVHLVEFIGSVHLVDFIGSVHLVDFIWVEIFASALVDHIWPPHSMTSQRGQAETNEAQ